ncbi:hypothetical protein P7C70_g6471, partial [Phenoliferia sp. Uapishka_3]
MSHGDHEAPFWTQQTYGHPSQYSGQQQQGGYPGHSYAHEPHSQSYSYGQLPPMNHRDDRQGQHSTYPAVQSSLWHRDTSPAAYRPVRQPSEVERPDSRTPDSHSPHGQGAPALPTLSPRYNHADNYSWEESRPNPAPTQGTEREKARRSVSGASAPASGHPKIKPFVSKLHSLLADPDSFQDCIVWDQTGTSFVLSHANPRLLQDVLPKTFGHQNLQSFTRQLNVYDFKRLALPELLERLELGPTVSTIEYSGWYHPSFQRDETSELITMTPRPSRARLAKKMEKLDRLEQQRRKSFA